MDYPFHFCCMGTYSSIELQFITTIGKFFISKVSLFEDERGLNELNANKSKCYQALSAVFACRTYIVKG